MTKDLNPTHTDQIPNGEIGDFAVGQEQAHHNQHPNRFSEGQEITPDDDKKSAVGDFATGEEKQHEHHVGAFAEAKRTG